MFLLDTLLGIGGKVVDRLVPDKNKAQDQDHERRIGQQSVNIEQAKSSFLFVAGARAFLMWGFGSALIYKVIIFPVAKFYGVELPVLETDGLYQLLIILLGA